MKKIIEKFKKKFLLLGIKDASDKNGRYIKIQGRGWSILLKDRDKDFIISSESTGTGFLLFKKSIKDFNNPSRLISEQESTETLSIFKDLLEKEGYKISIGE